jgi:hypothetical protein
MHSRLFVADRCWICCYHAPTDIECTNRKGIFPEPEHDAVIQIANLVTVLGESKPFVRNVFTLHSCSSIGMQRRRHYHQSEPWYDKSDKDTTIAQSRNVSRSRCESV